MHTVIYKHTMLITSPCENLIKMSHCHMTSSNTLKLHSADRFFKYACEEMLQCFWPPNNHWTVIPFYRVWTPRQLSEQNSKMNSTNIFTWVLKKFEQKKLNLKINFVTSNSYRNSLLVILKEKNFKKKPQNFFYHLKKKIKLTKVKFFKRKK